MGDWVGLGEGVGDSVELAHPTASHATSSTATSDLLLTTLLLLPEFLSSPDQGVCYNFRAIL